MHAWSLEHDWWDWNLSWLDWACSECTALDWIVKEQVLDQGRYLRWQQQQTANWFALTKEGFKFFKRSFKFQNYTILTAFPSFATLLGSKGWRPPILWGTHSQEMKRLRAADFLFLNFWFEKQESLMSVEDFCFKGNVRPLEAAQKVWTTANPWFEAGKVFYTTTHQIL